MTERASQPIRIAIVDDYDVVLEGLRQMLRPYEDRVVVVELDATKPVKQRVDIVLYDTFAQPESNRDDVNVLVQSKNAQRVVVYTWTFRDDLVESARSRGIRGYLSKTLPAAELVAALEAVHAGEVVVSTQANRAGRVTTGLDWPGRGEGLTDRESELLALVTQGYNNAEIAELTLLRPNTVKSYLRNVYRKIGAGSRSQAVLWGVKHGFLPDHDRMENWRG